MIDDMDHLYTHASEAFRAGEHSGRDRFRRAVRQALSAISVKHERSGNDAGFHAVEECCKAIREIGNAFDEEKVTL